MDVDVERRSLLFDQPVHSDSVMDQSAVSIYEDRWEHVGVHFWFFFQRFWIRIDIVTVVGCVVVIVG